MEGELGAGLDRSTGFTVAGLGRLDFFLTTALLLGTVGGSRSIMKYDVDPTDVLILSSGSLEVRLGIKERKYLDMDRIRFLV